MMVNEKKRTPTFKRTDFSKYSKLGVRRKNKQVYRKAKGIDNKIKLKMKGHLRKVMIGFKNESKSRGLIDGLESVMVFNVKDLDKIVEGKIGIVGKVGMKKKIGIAEVALEKKLRLQNLNAKKFLIEVKEVEKAKEEKKAEREGKKKEKAKAVKEAEKKAEEEKKKETDSEKKESIEDKIDEKEKVEEKVKDVKKKTENNKTEIQTNNYGRGK